MDTKFGMLLVGAITTVVACGTRPSQNNGKVADAGAGADDVAVTADVGTQLEDDVTTSPDAGTFDDFVVDDYFQTSEVGAIPEYPQREGDPELGYDILINEGYVSCGIPTRIYDTVFGGTTPDSLKLAGRRPITSDLPFNRTRFERDGIELVSTNCLSCHANVLPSGGLMVGLGNEGDHTLNLASAATLGRGLVDEENQREVEEYDRFLQRVTAAAPYVKTDTIGVNPADNLPGILTAHRNPDTWEWLEEPWYQVPETGIVPLSVPPWWHVKKKNAMYYTALGRGDHARFMMAAALLCTDTLEEARQIDEWFVHVRAYLETIEPPKYPWPVNETLAADGEAVFEANCSRCHGTYGADWTYPNLVVAIEEVGTDPMLAVGGYLAVKEPIAWLNRSFFGELSIVSPAQGYVAPPLDGIWATAPYFHNASVPTVAAVIDSSTRPTYWKRNWSALQYDPDRMGHVYEELDYGKEGTDSTSEKKAIYDTTRPGYDNGGHTYGDALAESDRTALLEYLKTL